MQPVFLMIGGVMTGLAIGRREIILLAMGVMASGIGWFNPDGRSAPASTDCRGGSGHGRLHPVTRVPEPAPTTALGRHVELRLVRVLRPGPDSSTSSARSDSGWFGGGESGGGGASADWGSDSGNMIRAAATAVRRRRLGRRIERLTLRAGSPNSVVVTHVGWFGAPVCIELHRGHILPVGQLLSTRHHRA